MAVHTDDMNAKRPRRNESATVGVAVEPTAPHSDPDAPIVALLDHLGGAGEGPALLRRLRESEQPPRLVAQSVAASPAFEQLYKQARTGEIGVDGGIEADAAFVGLPDLPSGLSFNELFKLHFRPRLGKRADGFAAIFGALPRRPARSGRD